MSPLITDYGAWQWCEVCERITLTDAYDDDADMCVRCAEVNDAEM